MRYEHSMDSWRPTASLSVRELRPGTARETGAGQRIRYSLYRYTYGRADTLYVR